MSLPPRLLERVAPNATAPRAGAYVIYWLRVAMRSRENPSLDVALSMARELGVPCFVYQGLSERYRYASDRLHTFMLEGARDLQQALADRGIGYALHLQHAADRGPHLLELAKHAALVVTDAMPVQPLLKWDAEVAAVAPLWRVDSSCVAPMWLADEPFERASVFTQKLQPLWAARIDLPWVDVEPSHPAFLPELPFEPLSLQERDLAELVARCDLDHSIGPVHDTPGGTASASARWEAFRDRKLDTYDRDRNDPLLEGNSRMSAYLHFGQISPFRLAREANARRTAGSEKFLSELLTWRELSWNLCRFTPNVDSVEALPAWARETLKAHERDRREFLPSWEQLARAQTGDLLWDSAQRSLLTHGELHNAVRMTWAKALIGWSRTAQEALTVLIDLNHRFALDGRDPSSYAGILWCLGALDRPFAEQPMMGTVRARSTTEYSKRIDLPEYSRRMRLPSRGAPLVVAVVGAGVAGAAAARTLSDAGHAVTLFDKGRIPGGRATSSAPRPPPYVPPSALDPSTPGLAPELRFDHGAQFFTVTDERFARVARAWWHERVLNEWSPRLMTSGESLPAEPVVRLVAMPAMSTLLTRMLYDLDVRSSVRVHAMTRTQNRWKLSSDDQQALGEFDAVVLAAPAPQSADLIDPASYALASRIREAQFEPCWAVMVAFDEPLGLEHDAAFVNLGPLKWLARDSSKPERAPGERWVLHANAEWSQKHLEDSPEQVGPMLLDAFFATTGARKLTPSQLKAHRWRYALVTKPLGEPCVFDASLRVAACGDWCLGSTLESAYLSGVAAAGRINSIAPDPEPEPDPMALMRAAQIRLL